MVLLLALIPAFSPEEKENPFGIIRLFYARPPIQPRVYPEALGTFHLLQGEKAGMRAGKSHSMFVAKILVNNVLGLSTGSDQPCNFGLGINQNKNKNAVDIKFMVS